MLRFQFPRFQRASSKEGEKMVKEKNVRDEFLKFQNEALMKWQNTRFHDCYFQLETGIEHHSALWRHLWVVEDPG